MSEFLDKKGLSYLWGKIKQITPEGGSAYVPTLNAAPTSSTTTYTKDEQTVDFEIGQFARVAKQGDGYDFYQLYDLVTESNVTTATWVKAEYEGGKQDTITANGILKGNGSGGVTAAVSGTDYVAPISGKGLSTNDYTDDDRNKLAGIAEGAEVNVQSDWNATSGDAFIQNKPVIPQLPVLSNGHEYVDLGLPSGTLWATMNVGAASETDYGNYYMYGMGSKTYDNADTPYASTEDPLDLSKDTARVVWGGDWRMPTRAQMQELTANTTYQWVTNYKGSGINGGTFTATNGAVLFIPAAGIWSRGSQRYVDSYGYYWGSSPFGSKRAYGLSFSNGSEDVGNFDCKYGYSVRPVITPSNTLHKVSVTGDYNDLNNKPTIPTGVKGDAESEYRTGNVNITPANIGLGNVGNFKAVSTVANQGLTDTEKTNARTNIGAGTSSFSGSYNDLTNKPVIPELIGDDAARANWGGDWRMPTVAEYQALGDAVTCEWTTDYQGSGVRGLVCTDKTDSSKVLFFPANGVIDRTWCDSKGDVCFLWSSTLDIENRIYGISVCLYSSGQNWKQGFNRIGGEGIRPVLDGTITNNHNYVEIGGIKWATMNIGANNVTDDGLYFQWGDTQGYTVSQVGSGEGKIVLDWVYYKYGNGTSNPSATDLTKYNATDGLTTLEISTPAYILREVAITGDYNDLENKPFSDDGIPTSLLADDLQGHVYVDLGLPSGTLWATRNVGAVDETDVGDYYMIGNGVKKYSIYDNTPQGEGLNLEHDTARQVWGDEWRTPTMEEANELVSNTVITYQTNYKNSGANGYKLTGPNGNYIFLVDNKCIYEGNVQSTVFYIVTTTIRNNSVLCQLITQQQGTIITPTVTFNRSFGLNVRPVRSKVSVSESTIIEAPVDATDATAPITALTCEAGKYYRIDVAVNTLAVTLPAMTDNTTVKSIVLFLHTDTTPVVTFTSTAPSGGTAPTILYQENFGFDASNYYEVNCLWNGLSWVIAAVKIVASV